MCETTTDPIEPLLPKDEVKQILDVSDSEFYRMLGDGRLTAVKLGRRLLVHPAVVRALIASLPAAEIRPDRAAVRRRMTQRSRAA